jgi:hypothetical protein
MGRRDKKTKGQRTKVSERGSERRKFVDNGRTDRQRRELLEKLDARLLRAPEVS